MLESIKKLRTFESVVLDEIADEIQTEIESRYMPLPVDADSVPIRVGDRVTNMDSEPFEVYGVGRCRGKDIVYDSFGVWVRSCNCRLLKQRTVADVIKDALDDFTNNNLCVNEVVEKYEAELRELLGGDAS